MAKKKKNRQRSSPSKRQSEGDLSPAHLESIEVTSGQPPNGRLDGKKLRGRLFLEEKHIPRWKFVLAVLGFIIAVLGIILAYLNPWRTQAIRDAAETSRIPYAFFIKPAPVPGEEVENNRRWEVSIMIANTGPRTAQSFVLNLYTPDPQFFLHSEPKVMSSPAAAEIQINKRIPDGIYQVVFKNFVPGDTCFLNMFYATDDDKREEFYKAWSNGGMFDEGFGKRFINQFWFTGERLKVENSGMLGLEPSFEPL